MPDLAWRTQKIADLSQRTRRQDHGRFTTSSGNRDAGLAMSRRYSENVHQGDDGGMRRGKKILEPGLRPDSCTSIIHWNGARVPTKVVRRLEECDLVGFF